MTLIRARQAVVTRTFPHNANKRYIIPGGQRQWRNMLANSRWKGLGGDYSVGNWVNAEGWVTENWPPADAEAWPRNDWNACHFFSGATGPEQRGYMIYRMQMPIGVVINASIYVDQIGAAPTTEIVHMASYAGTQQTLLDSPIIPTAPGRYSARYRTVTNDVEFRVGIGARTAQATLADFVVSRPQVSGGDALLPWQGSGLNPGPWDEELTLTVGDGGTFRGFQASPVIGGLSPANLFTHRVRNLWFQSSDLGLVQWYDNKAYGVPALFVEFPESGVAGIRMPWNVTSFDGTMFGIWAWLGTKIGEQVKVRIKADFA